MVNKNTLERLKHNPFVWLLIIFAIPLLFLAYSNLTLKYNLIIVISWMVAFITLLWRTAE